MTYLLDEFEENTDLLIAENKEKLQQFISLVACHLLNCYLLISIVFY
jgi:hypothetical protein